MRMTRVLIFLKHNAIAIAALFVALGGTSYAAVAIPRNSVGTSQLRNGAVTRSKLSKAASTEIAAVTQVDLSGSVLRSQSTPSTASTQGWETGPNGESGVVVYPHSFPRTCAPVVTAQSPASAGSTAPPSVSARPLTTIGFSKVQVFASSGTGITLSIVCPRGA